MKNLALTLLITLGLCSNLSAKKFNFKFLIDGIDEVENELVTVSYIAFNSLPTESTALKDSFLIVNNSFKELNLKSDHNSIIFFCHLFDSKSKLIRTKKYSISKADLKEKPENNNIPLDIFRDGSLPSINRLTVDEFGDFINQLVVKKSTAAIVDSSRFTSNNDYELGTLLFVNELTGTSLKYELDISQLTPKFEDINISEFHQHNLIDINKESQSSIQGNFKGVYAGLALSMKNSRFVEYKLDVYGHKKRKVSNLSNSLYSFLLSSTPLEFLQIAFDQINAAAEKDKNKFKLLMVTSQYWVDSLTLVNKSYKQVEVNADLDVDVFDFLKVDSDNKYALNKSFQTSFKAEKFYLDYEITDYTSAFLHAAIKYKGVQENNLWNRMLTFYDGALNQKKTAIQRNVQSISTLLPTLYSYVSGLPVESQIEIMVNTALEPVPQGATEPEKRKIQAVNRLIARMNEDIDKYISYSNVVFPLKAAIAGIGIEESEIETIVIAYRMTQEFESNFSRAT